MALVRATALMDFRSAALSTTGVSGVYQLTGMSSGMSVYGALHLTSAYASTDREVSWAIQSATSSGMTGAATRISFTQSTLAAGIWGTPASNFSTENLFWQGSWTMSTTNSTNGQWKGVLEMGIK